MVDLAVPCLVSGQPVKHLEVQEKNEPLSVADTADATDAGRQERVVATADFADAASSICHSRRQPPHSPKPAIPANRNDNGRIRNDNMAIFVLVGGGGGGRGVGGGGVGGGGGYK